LRVECYEKLQNGIVLQTTRGLVKVEVWADHILRVVYTLEEEFSQEKGPMVIGAAEQGLNWRLEAEQDLLKIKTNEIELHIDRANCAFKYYDLEGNLLAQEPARGGKELSPAPNGQAYQWKLGFEWSEDEAIYGLGSYEEGILNYRGHTQYMYQQNMRCVVPVFLSTNGYGVLFDSYSLMIFRDDVHGSYVWSESNDEMDYYFIYGPEFDQVVAGYRALTGQVPMFPKWLFGYIQSKERYQSQAELISVVQEYRQREIPLDCIVLDWMSWEGNLWGQKSLDPARFPAPEKMMDQLHALNVRLMVSVWPHMENNGPNQLEMKKHGYLLGDQSTYNAFNKQAREMYWRQADEGLFSKGIDAWWCDSTEPFEADWQGKTKPQPEQRMIMNTSESKKYLDPRYINAYSLYHSQGIYEGQRAVTDEKRVVNLTRSSYAGQQRYGAITWSGDISANWATLRRQIADGLNFCLAGIPYWTLDIGGFFVGSSPHEWFRDGDFNEGHNDLGYHELYVRWLQLGTFLPIFRSHGTDTPREIWRFGEPGSKFYDTLAKFINLRYRLLPYIYSLAGWVSSRDYTIMRALPFDFKDDSNTYNIADQFMFGPSFLVNPITNPMYYGPGSKQLKGVDKSRQVYLPAGADWYDFWTGERYQGGQDIRANAELETMPLYVKAGSIVPLGPQVQHTGEKPHAPLELRIYCGSDGEFAFYDDDGDGYAYEQGQYQLININWDDEGKRLLFSDRLGAGYAQMPESITFKVVLVAPGKGVGLEEADQTDQTVVYKGKALEIEF